MGLRNLLDRMFNDKVSEKRYHNAELYNLLGNDYDNILLFGFGRIWTYDDINKNFVKKVNKQLGLEDTIDEFKSGDTTKNLLRLKDLHEEELKRIALEVEMKNKAKIESNIFGGNGTSGKV